jgi:hypothetical protein
MRRITLPPIALTISLAGLIGGCASLEQAPLTYSSVQTMGLSVAAATPQQPGLDITIGYKGADVAYTPVAVAKKCGEKPTADCNKIESIFGTSNGETTSSNQTAYDKARRDLENASNTRAIAEKDVTDETAKFNSAENACKGAEATRQGLGPTTDAAKKQDAVEFEKKSCDEFEALKVNRNARQSSLQKAVEAAKQQETAAQAEVGRLSTESKVGAQRKDSYSVFGTFNGDAGADKDGGTLKLGKTFSTGVAAQRYSEGLKSAATLVAMKQCLDAATAMLVAAKVAGEDMIKQAKSLCAIPTETTDQ